MITAELRDLMLKVVEAAHDMHNGMSSDITDIEAQHLLQQVSCATYTALQEIDDEWRAARDASRRAANRPPVRSPSFESTLEDLA